MSWIVYFKIQLCHLPEHPTNGCQTTEQWPRSSNFYLSYDVLWFPEGKGLNHFFSQNPAINGTRASHKWVPNHRTMRIFRYFGSWKAWFMKYGKYGHKSPALTLIEKFCPGRERILEMWPFILIAICSVGCISLTAPASTSLWILAPFSKEPSAPDWEQQCHKMGAWINCLYQCMTSLSQLEMWKMPIVYGSKHVTTV